MGKRSKSKSQDCPCGSGKVYTVCCAPFIESERLPSTAEQLMRSRYSAYALAQADYLLATWHPSTRPAKLDFASQPKMKWILLTILQTVAGGGEDDTGMVEFDARFTINGKAEVMHEKSEFVREQGRWYYLKAQNAIS